MVIWLPMPPMGMTDVEMTEVQKRVTESWLLYGEVHITNAPNGRGLTILDPTRITYEAGPTSLPPSPSSPE